MYRWFWIWALLLAACQSRQQENHLPPHQEPPDTLPATAAGSFDMLVRKYEDPQRQTWQDPRFVIAALGNLENKVIADIGAGTGYFTFQVVVPARKVIAIDIEQRFLNYIEERKAEMYDRQLADKIETRLTTARDPGLQPAEADVVLMVNTITFIPDRAGYLGKLKAGMATGGLLVIVDFKPGRLPVGPREEEKLPPGQLAADLQQAGFRISATDTTSLQYQYLIKAINSPLP